MPLAAKRSLSTLARWAAHRSDRSIGVIAAPVLIAGIAVALLAVVSIAAMAVVTALASCAG